MDMEFTQQTDPADDNALIEAVGRTHGKVVLATVNVTKGGATDILGGEPLLRELGARPSEVRLTLDSDGTVRRFEREYNKLGSFPVVAAETMIGHKIPASTFQGRKPADRLCGATRNDQIDLLHQGACRENFRRTCSRESS